MWRIEPTTRFLNDRRWYQKKRQPELEAVMHNLDRYLSMLNEAPNAGAVSAGFLHAEGEGVVAIDQKGGGKTKRQETRLYTFADESEKVVYLITIGNKKSQQEDIKLCKRFVRDLLKEKRRKGSEGS